MNLRCASGPRAPADGLFVDAEAHREDRGREMAVTVRMFELISGMSEANWRMVKMAR